MSKLYALCFKPLRLGAVFLWAITSRRSFHRLLSFKPLRLGAVFLCVQEYNGGQYCWPVSNPCASGRCSSAVVCHQS